MAILEHLYQDNTNTIGPGKKLNKDCRELEAREERYKKTQKYQKDYTHEKDNKTKIAEGQDNFEIF